MTTDTTEKGLESLIVASMTGAVSGPCPGDEVAEIPLPFDMPPWTLGDSRDYDREHAIDLVQFRQFLEATQPGVAESMDLGGKSPTRLKFLARLQG